MYQIVCNEKGSRTLEVLDEHLETIEKHNLFTDLLDSNGIVNENVLEKLRLNVRSLLNNEHPDAGLLKLCQDILFHDNMKAFGLHQLILLFLDWEPRARVEYKHTPTDRMAAYHPTRDGLARLGLR